MRDDPGLFATVYSARALRRFRPDPVPDDVLFQLMDALPRSQRSSLRSLQPGELPRPLARKEVRAFCLPHVERMRRTLQRGLSVLVLCVTQAAVYAVPYAFESGDFLVESSAWGAWTEMLTRHAEQLDGLQACLADKAACTRRMRSLHVVLAQGAALPRDKQIQLVNRYVNRKRYNEDRRKIIRNQNGTLSIPSHWATLVEFLEKGGDCEDFATAKYLLLRRFGFGAEDMRIVVVYDRSHRSHHAVLAMRLDGETTWVLDSDNRIYRKRRPPGYRYVYAVNENGIWDHDIRIPPRRRRP